MAEQSTEATRSERFGRYVEALIEGGRPSPDDVAGVDEAEMARLAAEISGAGGAASAPDAAFVDQLRLRMRAADEGISAVRVPPPIRPEAVADSASRWRISRRDLLRAGLGAATGLAAGAAAGYVLRDATGGPDSSWTDAEMVGGEGDWVEVAAMRDLPPGAVAAFHTAAFDGFVVNDGGEVRALGAACTHLGCTLQYRDEFGDLRCPCHGASFNLRGWLANSRQRWDDDGPYADDAAPYPVELPPLARPKVKVEDELVFVWTARV